MTTSTTPTAQTFDYIVVGGGAAGCVVASRLSEDPAVRVCLLEAGGPDSSVLIHAPMGFAVSAPLKIHNWSYETVPQPGFNGRRGYQGDGRQYLYQRYGLHPRPPGRLRPLGQLGQPRLEL